MAGGGGGYGDPLDREPERVLTDVIDGYVSIEGARSDYGVIVREKDGRLLIYELDQTATTTLRSELKDVRASD